MREPRIFNIKNAYYIYIYIYMYIYMYTRNLFHVLHILNLLSIRKEESQKGLYV